MTQNPNAERSENTDETQVLPTSPAPDDTQVLATDQTQSLPTVGPDDPLSVFDQPTPQPTYSTPETSSYPTTSYPAAETYPTASYPAYTEPAPAEGYPTGAYPADPAPAWTPPPAPPVKTTPRTSTIVWGFVILAIGIGVLSVVAGATIDVGLAMIWLLAAAGAVLVVASIAGAARRRNRSQS